MPLKAGAGARPRVRLSRRSGFSLLEVVVASALLLMTCAGVSSVVASSLRGEGREARRARLEAALEAEVQRLTALPHTRLASPPAAPGASLPTPSSLLAAVFPHALAAYNSQAAQCAPDPLEPSVTVFTMVTSEPWGELRSTARFVNAAGGGWSPVAAEGVKGWAVWQAGPPPSSAVEVTLVAVAGEPGADPRQATSADPRRVIVLDALRPATDGREE